MNTYRFHIYYEWQGPSQSDPFATEKTQPELYRALSHVPSEFSHRIADPSATVTHSELNEDSKVLQVSVATSATREVVIAAMEATLKDWRLFGHEVREPSAASQETQPK